MHDCTGCGCACYCHGDIDDCVVETAEYSYMHCVGCGCAEDEMFCDDGQDDDSHLNMDCQLAEAATRTPCER